MKFDVEICVFVSQLWQKYPCVNTKFRHKVRILNVTAHNAVSFSGILFIDLAAEPTNTGLMYWGALLCLLLEQENSFYAAYLFRSPNHTRQRVCFLVWFWRITYIYDCSVLTDNISYLKMCLQIIEQFRNNGAQHKIKRPWISHHWLHIICTKEDKREGETLLYACDLQAYQRASLIVQWCIGACGSVKTMLLLWFEPMFK